MQMSMTYRFLLTSLSLKEGDRNFKETINKPKSSFKLKLKKNLMAARYGKPRYKFASNEIQNANYKLLIRYKIELL